MNSAIWGAISGFGVAVLMLIVALWVINGLTHKAIVKQEYEIADLAIDLTTKETEILWLQNATRELERTISMWSTVDVLLQRKLYKDIQWQDEYGVKGWTQTPAISKDAQIVSSEIGEGVHCPVLDIDVRAYLLPSSTEGHSHLYINHPMRWRPYKRMLKAMARAGVLEKGYVKASIRRKHTAVRVPWLKKGDSGGR